MSAANKKGADLTVRAFPLNPGAQSLRGDVLDLAIGQAGDHQGEGPVEGGFAQAVETAGCAAMAGTHIHLQEGETVIGATIAHAGDVFSRFPISHAGIGQATGGQDVRIGRLGDLVVRVSGIQ